MDTKNDLANSSDTNGLIDDVTLNRCRHLRLIGISTSILILWNGVCDLIYGYAPKLSGLAEPVAPDLSTQVTRRRFETKPRGLVGHASRQTSAAGPSERTDYRAQDFLRVQYDDWQPRGRLVS